MSASNWAICPACLNKAQTELERLYQEIQASYGQLPLEEFDALRTRHAAGINHDEFRTFREDYEFYGAEDGTVVATYSGHCQKCNVGTDFVHRAPFWTASFVPADDV